MRITILIANHQDLASLVSYSIRNTPQLRILIASCRTTKSWLREGAFQKAKTCSPLEKRTKFKTTHTTVRVIWWKTKGALKPSGSMLLNHQVIILVRQTLPNNLQKMFPIEIGQAMLPTAMIASRTVFHSIGSTGSQVSTLTLRKDRLIDLATRGCSPKGMETHNPIALLSAMGNQVNQLTQRLWHNR